MTQRAGRPTLAVVGATGVVGGVLRELLSTRQDVWGEIRLLASPRSAGRRLPVRGEELEVAALARGCFAGVDVALFDVPDEVAAHWAPIAAAEGAIVVDNSEAFRNDPQVPLVVPEVNPHAARVRPREIVSSPHSVTLAMIVAVGALHSALDLNAVTVTSFQAASGAGQAGTDTLRTQLDKASTTTGLGTQPGDLRRAVGDFGPFAAPLALNVVPWVGALEQDGWASQEWALRDESRRILDLPSLAVSATCVRVPVVTAHSMAVHARFEQPVDADRAQLLLAEAPGVVLVDDPEGGEFPTPADAVGTDPVWAGRVRRSLDDPQALELFLVGDNLRKGAALNVAQIAEIVADELRAAE